MSQEVVQILIASAVLHVLEIGIIIHVITHRPTKQEASESDLQLLDFEFKKLQTEFVRAQLYKFRLDHLKSLSK